MVAPVAPHTGACGKDYAAAATWKSSAEIPSTSPNAAAKWTRLSRLEILPPTWKSTASPLRIWSCSSADRPGNEDVRKTESFKRLFFQGQTSSIPFAYYHFARDKLEDYREAKARAESLLLETEVASS